MKKNEAQSRQKETVRKSEMLKRKRRTRIEKEGRVSETKFCSCKRVYGSAVDQPARRYGEAPPFPRSLTPGESAHWVQASRGKSGQDREPVFKEQH